MHYISLVMRGIIWLAVVESYVYLATEVPRPLSRALEGGGAPTEHPDYRTVFECTLLLLITSDSATSTSHHVIILIRTSLRRIYPPLFNQFSYHLRLDRDPQYTACTPVN